MGKTNKNLFCEGVKSRSKINNNLDKFEFFFDNFVMERSQNEIYNENINNKLNNLINAVEKAVNYLLDILRKEKLMVSVYTHLDADGLSSGAIIAKALYKEKIRFKLIILKQLEKAEILKIKNAQLEKRKALIFLDFGSGQYHNLIAELKIVNQTFPILILDHHLPYNIGDKKEYKKIENILIDTYPWHVNPYFYGIDGSEEISGAGICYYFAKMLNKDNIDLSPLAIVGAKGDMQNKGVNKSFMGINKTIINDAISENSINIVDDLNLKSKYPLNQSLAYSPDIKIKELKDNPNTCLKFLNNLKIKLYKENDEAKTIIDLTQEEKQILLTGIITYAAAKDDIDLKKIVDNLIVKRYVLNGEKKNSLLYDIETYSSFLNACGRMEHGELGIAVAMGDRKKFLEKGLKISKKYGKLLKKSLNWVRDNNMIKELENIQYLLGEEKIPENIIGTISSILIFDDDFKINKSKPIFGIAKRKGEDIYKVSSRAHESIVVKGLNLSTVIREVLETLDIEFLGGGHPAAAGAKIPTNMLNDFLKLCNKKIKIN